MEGERLLVEVTGMFCVSGFYCSCELLVDSQGGIERLACRQAIARGKRKTKGACSFEQKVWKFRNRNELYISKQQ